MEIEDRAFEKNDAICEGKSENSEELSGESGSWEFLTKRAVHEKYCFHEKLRLDCLGFFSL